jgi:hypothetical protein
MTRVELACNCQSRIVRNTCCLVAMCPEFLIRRWGKSESDFGRIGHPGKSRGLRHSRLRRYNFPDRCRGSSRGADDTRNCGIVAARFSHNKKVYPDSCPLWFVWVRGNEGDWLRSASAGVDGFDFFASRGGEVLRCFLASVSKLSVSLQWHPS